MAPLIAGDVIPSVTIGETGLFFAQLIAGDMIPSITTGEIGLFGTINSRLYDTFSNNR